MGPIQKETRLVAVTAIVTGLVMNSHAQSIRLSDEQAARIAAKIWQKINRGPPTKSTELRAAGTGGR
jgi:hypothetical protein